MDLTDNKRLFSLTPVVEGNPPSRVSKYPFIPVMDINTLGEFIVVPPFTTNSVGYFGRKVFQYNIAFGYDFYIPNAAQIARFGQMLLLGGCLTIKYRSGVTVLNGVNYPNVFRYKLLDSHGLNDNWSGIPWYNGELIKNNFVLEFIQDTSVFARGVSQQFMLRTSAIIQPIVTGQDNTFDTEMAPYDVAVSATPYPANFPIDNSIEAFLDNL